MGEPEYHPGARQFDPSLFDMDKMRSEVGPAAPPLDTLVDSLAQEWNDKEFAGMDGGVRVEVVEGGRVMAGSETLWSKSAHGSSVSIPSQSHFCKFPVLLCMCRIQAIAGTD